MRVAETWVRSSVLLFVGASAAVFVSANSACAQRALGTDVSYWQGEITQIAWDYAYDTGDRVYAFVRSTRGGTTGLGQTSGTPGGGSQETLSRRYDDSRFIQNMVRANNAGLMTGPYHFARPDILSNTGANEADHFMQMAGIYMRPGYMLPMYDLEAGQAERSQQDLADFSLAFSNRIYEVMKIRPSIYSNGNYMNDLAGANAATRNALAQPSPNGPSMEGPAFPVLFGARYPAGSGNPYNGDIQNESPKTTNGSTSNLYYGPWDDYGNSQPWHFWQYSSGEQVFGEHGDLNVDGDIAQGDIEFVRDTLVPAVWWNDSSGDWSTFANWNSGQPVVAPTPGPGQATPFANGPLPVPRLPGAAGTGPTSGQYDTVILERPTADITVTISTGTHNVRKMYMREALEITGGSLTINYNPNYNNDFDNNPATNFPNALRSGPISAQFSGPVTLSGGSLNVHTVQLDAGKTFTLGGGTLTFDKINLISNAATKINVTGEVNVNPLNNATATIARDGGAGSIDLTGGTRQINVGNGSADVDLSVAVPITNGSLIKSGSGTMRLDAANSLDASVTVSGGTLRYGHSSGLSSSTIVTVNSASTLDLNGISDTVAALSSDAGQTTGVVQQGAASLTLSAASGDYSFTGSISGSGAFTKNGGATQRLSGSNTLGAVSVNDGALLMFGSQSTSSVTVNGGTFGGTGTVSGNTTVNSSGHLAPGASTGTLNLASLTLNPGSVLDMELGMPIISDKINVTGQLVLNGGSINLTNFNGLMEYGNYTLIDYGTLVGDVASLGTPIGPAGFSYDLIDTGSLIRLVVSPAGVPGDFNEDTIVDAADYVVWQKFNGTSVDLANDDDLPGPIGEAHYNLWLQNFGRYEGDGLGTGGNVPEPAAAVLLILAIAGWGSGRRRS